MAKKPPGKCIFCGRGPLSNPPVRMSKEHIWADWLKDFIPRPYARTSHVTSLHIVNPVTEKIDSQYETGILNRVGDPKAQKLRITCIPCNNGWMSQLQERTKPILSQLIKGNWENLSDTNQKILAAWACMLSMVYEQSYQRTTATTDEERLFLLNNNQPPDFWEIWIGNYIGTEQIRTKYTGMYLTPPFPPENAPLKFNTQITTFVVGKVLFHCVSSTSETQLSLDILYDNYPPLVRIWPVQPKTIFVPTLPLDKNGAEGIHSNLRSLLWANF